MSAPCYNIDEYSPEMFSEKRRPIDIAYDLWALIERDGQGQLRADTDLCIPEIRFRDFTHFHSAYMGNGFAEIAWQGNGRSMLWRAILAAREIALSDALMLLDQALEIFQRNGIKIPCTLNPEWWIPDEYPGAAIDTLRTETAHLTELYWTLPSWPEPNCIYTRLLRYMQRHRRQLMMREA